MREALLDTPVVALNGARQVGKSTLVERLLDQSQNTKVLTLDDETQMEAARSDPTTFIDHGGLLVVDEVQRAPGLFHAIKAAVDRDRQTASWPGGTTWTGSVRVATPSPSEEPGGADARWYANYVTTVIERMVAETADIERL